MSSANLQSCLIFLLVIFSIQFFILFHIVHFRENVQSDSKFAELLNVIETQQQQIQNQYIQSHLGTNSQFLTQTKKSSKMSVDNKCETVHVCIVCTGYKSSRIVITMIKSLVFYRRSRLHLHLVVDNVSLEILSRLFQTWNIPAFDVSYYSTKPLLPKVVWIQNTHYSGIYGLMKLVVIDILPTNLTKVIVLDTDLTFNVDITELWQTFSKFQSKQAIGLVENQSNWYRGKTAWPALGRGYNTGVILLELSKLRTMKWSKYWRQQAKIHLGLYHKTQLGDQDILNAIIKTAPHLLYELPCEWNVQLSYLTTSESCYKRTEPKVVHWNSLSKEPVPNRHGEFFQRLHRTFVEYDGNLLRKAVPGCTSLHLPPSSSSPSSEVNGCQEMKLAGSAIYRTHVFFLPFNNSADVDGDVDVTLVTQLSSDRILMLEMLASQWTGPISVAIFASDVEVQNLVKFVASSTVLRLRRNIGYHIVYKEFESLELYPVNHLRNVAMEQVKTPFLMHMDVDFMPKMKLREYILQIIEEMKLTVDSKVALVVAPFETSLHHFGLPFIKKHVLKLWENKQVAPFRFSVWKPGQYPLNYEKWKNANKTYNIEWKPHFEPYVVVSNKSPRFDPRFVGFGWNKAAYSLALFTEGYQFIVLPEACIVHLPHSLSISNNKFRLNPKYRRCMSLLRAEFLTELNIHNATLSERYNNLHSNITIY